MRQGRSPCLNHSKTVAGIGACHGLEVGDFRKRDERFAQIVVVFDQQHRMAQPLLDGGFGHILMVASLDAMGKSRVTGCKFSTGAATGIATG